MLDTLIRGAKIVDGTGKAAFTADVGILDGMIEAVGNLSGAQAFETIEAAGRVLTPGFIDMHRHADAALFREDFGEAELCQGLTTLVNGNCGMSLAPLSGAHADECAKYLAPITGNIPPELRFASIDSYFKAAQGRGLPLSCAELIGMGTLRTFAAGFTTGDLSPLELRDLHYHMEAALADGACGVSLGLGYAPEIFYSTDGLIRALAPLHRSGVPICVHMRQEGDGVVDALREMLEVARALQTPLEVSHLKAIGGRNTRKAVPEMLSLIEKAREDGLDVMCDVYPYTAGSTQLIHVLPPEFQEGGTEALTKRLLDDAARKEMRARMEAGSDFENITLLVGFDNVVFVEANVMRSTDKIIDYLEKTYQPESIIVYGSFADGSANLNSDFDALIIAGKEKLHDSSFVDGVVLDVFIYPPDQFLSEYDPAEFAQVWDGKIILDKNGMGGWLKKNVLDYIEHIPLKTAKDVSQEIKWCEKMLLRTMRGDVEGYYRWHWLLCDSLEIYFDIKGIHYYGPKKALHFMEESDSEAFHIYSKALLEFNQEGLSDWINYLKTIF